MSSPINNETIVDAVRSVPIDKDDLHGESDIVAFAA